MSQLLHDVSWVVEYRSEFLTYVFEGFTWLGYPVFVMLFLPLGYWLWNKNAFTRLTILVILSTLLNAFLKDYWQNPRPDVLFHLDPGVGNSFGMPSGHAQIGAVLWFGLAFEIQKRWAWLLASLLVAGICLSRIYLGVHDLEDILAGLALAVVSLFVYRKMLGVNFAGFRNLSIWLHLLLLVIVQIIVLHTWPGLQNSIQAIVLGGFLCGWLLGSHIDRLKIQFEIRNERWSRPAVAVLGILGLILLITALKPVLSVVDPFYAGYIQTTLIGLYITAFAPMVFKAIKLSN